MSLLVAIDYETRDSRGASFEYYRKDFKIFSMSSCWLDSSGIYQHFFSVDPVIIRQYLTKLQDTNARVIAHNLPYEYGVTSAIYPDIRLNWYADTMRMSQLRDGGGDEFGSPILTMEQEIALELGEIVAEDITKLYNKTKGLRLEACAARFLNNVSHNHKSLAHTWLETHHQILKNHGQHLHLLPYEILKQYNNADTLITLQLFYNHIQYFKTEKFDWLPDHELYYMRARLLSSAYYNGIKIDTDRLFTYIRKLEIEVANIESQFFTQFSNEMDEVIAHRYTLFIAKTVTKLKSEAGKVKRLAAIRAGVYDKHWKLFNIGSSTQLEILFCKILKLTAKFETPKGSPSFKTTHLVQWGVGGEILKNRKKLLIVLQQSVNVYCASLYDGRVHCSVRASGTRTNRVAGGRI